MNEQTMKRIRREAQEYAEQYVFYSDRSMRLCREAVTLAERRRSTERIADVNIQLLLEHSASMDRDALQRAVHTRRNLLGEPSRFHSFGGAS